MTHVDPAEVWQLRAQLQDAVASICAPCAGIDPQTAQELLEDWAAWAAAPLDWLTAPELLAYGLELEHDVATLQGPQPRRYNTGPIRAGADAPATPPTHGIVTPGDVLAYRALWDDYVTGTARAAVAYPAPAPANINLQRYGAHPPDASILQLQADTEQSYSDAIMLRWNVHANTPDATILLNAGSILQDFQDTVLRVGQFYQPLIAEDCPAVALPAVPSEDAQTQVIARLEGLGVVVHGVLQLLAIGAGGALDTYGAIGSVVKKGAEAITSPLPWICLGLAGVGALALSARR
jgi:hypothetical protein